MQRLGLCGVLLGFVNCMAVQVPEDYVSDLYYGDTPKVVSATPSTSMQWTTLTQSIRIQFNNPMAASSLVIDSGGTCSGNLQFYDANNAGCRAITGVTSEKRDSIFTATIAGDLDPNSDYTITVGGSTTDFRGRTLGADQSFAFKSGVPDGVEPHVISVTASTTVDWDITIVFSKVVPQASFAGPIDSVCIGNIILLHNNTGTCNPAWRSPNTGDNITYVLHYKQPPAGNYTLTIKKDILDNFAIPMKADYILQLTH